MIILGRLFVGLGMLTLGRRLFWLFVGGVGFLLGINLAQRFVVDQSDGVVLIIALIFGLLGVIIALFLQRLAVGTAGFLGGGVIAMNIAEALAWNLGSELIPFVIGGILGMILVSILFDWTLIVLSSLTGATMIVEAVGWERPLALITMAGLAAVGIAIQASQMQRSREVGTPG